MNRTLIEWGTLAVAISALLYAVPEKYRIDQTFEITGQVNNLQLIPLSVEQQAQKGNDTTLLIRCKPRENPLQIECTAEGEQRSQAAACAQYLFSQLPQELGWVLPDHLKTLIDEKSVWLDSARTEYERLQNDVAAMNESLKKPEADVAKQKKQMETIETDLTNRRRQLEIVDEALAQNPDANRKKLFEEKKVEVLASVKELEEKLTQSQETIKTLSEPLEHRDTAKKAQEILTTEIAATEKWLAQAVRLVRNTKESVRVPDPDAFQISPLNSTPKPMPIRSWSHLPWTALTALLAFVYIRKRRIQVEPKATFASPDDVIRETGLPILTVFEL